MTAPTAPTLDQLVATMSEVFPKLDEDEQLLAVTLYRSLAEGRPVSLNNLAERSGLSAAQVGDALATWPGVFRDESQSVVGFWGLALPEMAHRYRVGGRQLYTWCAWDTLFITPILDQVAEVESRCPVTGGQVTLTVAPQGIRAVEPVDTVVSFLSPRERVADDVITTFCHYVLFFASADAGTRWTHDHPGTFLLSLDDAFELGRRSNRLRFGAALDAA